MPESYQSENSQSTLSSMLSLYTFKIINTKIPLYYEFPRNPNKASWKFEKLYEETRTIGGYVFEHWGKKPTILRVEGRALKNTAHASGLKNKEDYTDKGFREVVTNRDILKLRMLFELDKRNVQSTLAMIASDLNLKSTSDVLNSISDTIIQYKDDIYTGFFRSFNYEEDAENPFFNKYDFEFVVTNSMQEMLLQAVLNLNASVGAGVGNAALIGAFYIV